MKVNMKVARVIFALILSLAASMAMALVEVAPASTPTQANEKLEALCVETARNVNKDCRAIECRPVKHSSPKKATKKPARVIIKNKPAAPPAAAPAPVMPECLEARFPTQAGSHEVVVTFWGPEDIDLKNDACIQKNAATLVPCDRGEELCDFSDTQEVVGKKLLMALSYPTSPGDHVLYLPKAFLDEDKDYVTCMARTYGDETFPPVGNGEFASATAHNKAVARWKKLQYSDMTCLGYYSFHRSMYAIVYDSKMAMPTGAKYQTYFMDRGKYLYPD